MSWNNVQSHVRLRNCYTRPTAKKQNHRLINHLRKNHRSFHNPLSINEHAFAIDAVVCLRIYVSNSDEGWNGDKSLLDGWGLHESLFVFQLDCTSDSCTTLFLPRCLRYALPVASAKKLVTFCGINSFRARFATLPPRSLSCLLYAKTRLSTSCLRNSAYRQILESILCSLSGIPVSLFVSLYPFSRRFVSMGSRQAPVLNSVIYFAYVCWLHRVLWALLKDTFNPEPMQPALDSPFSLFSLVPTPSLPSFCTGWCSQPEAR